MMSWFDEKPLKSLKTRLKIEEGMTVKDVQARGNSAQKAAAILFDYNGDGHYSYGEALDFNGTSITNDTNKGEIRLYDRETKGSAPIKTVNIEEAKAEYSKKSAQYKKFRQTLTFYGIDYSQIERTSINDCEVKTVNGKTYLVLKAPEYELSMPIDKNFEPHKIRIYRAEAHNLQMENVKGTLTILGDNSSEYRGFDFHGDSNVTIIGRDGAVDTAGVSDNSAVTFKTGDYADYIKEWHETEPYCTTHHLKPGVTTVKAKNEEK